MNKYLVKIAKEVKVRDKLEDEDYGRTVGRGALTGAGVGLLSGRGKLSILGIAGAGLGYVAGASASQKNQLREQQIHDIKLQGAAQRQESHDARMHKFAEEKESANRSKLRTFAEGAATGLGVSTLVGMGAAAVRGRKNPRGALKTVGDWANGPHYPVGALSGAAAGGVAAFIDKKKNELLQKHASAQVSDQVKKDAFGLGTLVAAGGAGNLLSAKMFASGKLGKATNTKLALLGGGLGVVGDYAALKLGQAYNKHVDKK